VQKRQQLLEHRGEAARVEEVFHQVVVFDSSSNRVRGNDIPTRPAIAAG